MNIDSKEIINFLLKDNKDIEIMIGYNLFINKVKIYNRKQTIKYYQDQLKPLLEFFSSNNIINYQQINKPLLEHFINIRINKNLQNISINKEIKAFKTMSNYLINENYINPLNFKISKLKEEQKEIQIVKKNDLIKIINYLPNLSLNSQAIMLFLITTGTRTNEIINIKNKNINFNNNSIFLDFTKTNKPRYIFFDQHLKEILQKIYSTKNIYLFTNNNVQMKSESIRSIIKRIKIKLNIEILSPHKLRHTYATTLLKEGANIESIRKLLGHTTYEMTRRYLNLCNDDIQKDSINLNPYQILTKKENH